MSMPNPAYAPISNQLQQVRADLEFLGHVLAKSVGFNMQSLQLELTDTDQLKATISIMSDRTSHHPGPYHSPHNPNRCEHPGCANQRYALDWGGGPEFCTEHCPEAWQETLRAHQEMMLECAAAEAKRKADIWADLEKRYGRQELNKPPAHDNPLRDLLERIRAATDSLDQPDPNGQNIHQLNQERKAEIQDAARELRNMNYLLRNIIANAEEINTTPEDLEQNAARNHETQSFLLRDLEMLAGELGQAEWAAANGFRTGPGPTPAPTNPASRNS